MMSFENWKLFIWLNVILNLYNSYQTLHSGIFTLTCDWMEIMTNYVKYVFKECFLLTDRLSYFHFILSKR